jgi:hypothetical protein
VKGLRPGERVGYGGRFETSEPRTVAVVPAGYADGLDTRLCGRGGGRLLRAEALTEPARRNQAGGGQDRGQHQDAPAVLNGLHHVHLAAHCSALARRKRGSAAG